jgi:peptide methionine sulfoxide reductase msrA/msrB
LVFIDVDNNEFNKLSIEEENVIVNKCTEEPFKGEYCDLFEDGIYLCKRCNTPLYLSDSKFHSGCGWPSFDQEIKGNVTKIPDFDGKRTEIICTNCGAHLGHVFTGEGFTPKNTRHCVNSISLKYVRRKSDIAIFGTGCFWCSEAIFSKIKGVLSVIPGYAGGETENPDYEKVCSGIGNHAEVVKIEFNPELISYQSLINIFFEIHDPTSLNKQGNDCGVQYRSIILYTSELQHGIADKAIEELNQSGKFMEKIVTELKPLIKFYKAEDYHLDYYSRNKNQAYCSILIGPKIKHFEEQNKKILKNNVE